MDRKSCVVCLIILFLFCSIAQATNYSMRYNAQTGRGDWIIADSSIYSVVDEVYGAGWDGRTDEGASLNAIYDKIETVVGGGAPGGADTQVQFNDGGAFSGESTFIYNKALNSLSIDRIVIGPGVADYLMPTTRGAANTYLRDNGAGAVTFSALSGIGPANFTPNADFGDINTGAGGELRFGADSIDDSHLNWGSMTYLGEEGESLVTAYAAVGTFESGDTFICYEAGVGARECDYDDLPSGGSGGGFAWQLDPKSAKLPATNPMGIDAGNLQWRGLFDDTTDECARWQGVLTPYTSGLDIDIVYSLETTSTSDIVELEVYVMCGKSDADMDTDSFDSVNNLSSGSVSTTAGHQAKLTATLSNDDSCAEDDLIIIKICRDADDTDTTADDVEFRGASLHE